MNSLGNDITSFYNKISEEKFKNAGYRAEIETIDSNKLGRKFFLLNFIITKKYRLEHR